METLKGLLGEEKKSDEEDPWRQVQDCECLPSMSWEDRLWGFGICFGIGCLLSIMSSFMVPAIFTGHPAKFALPFTLGSICSLMSTSFLKGPCEQLKSMCAPTRIIATCVYLITMGLTLAAAFNKAPAIIVLTLIVIQYMALIWYSLSFIPYARGMVINCFKSCM